MSYVPPSLGDLNSLLIGPHTRHTAYRNVTVSYASGSWGAANLANFYPLRLTEPYDVKAAFWLKGSTVGSNYIDIGVYRMTELSTPRLDIIRSCGPVIASGSALVVQSTTVFRVSRAGITSGSDSTDSATYTTASVTLKAGRLYLMAVENSHGSAAHQVSSIDNAGTFVERATVAYNGSLNRVSVWSYVPTSDYTGTLVINFGGNTETGACWSLMEFANVDTSTNDGVVQTATGTGSSTTALATLAAFGSANNATYGAIGHAAATATTPGGGPGLGFLETHDVTAATPAQALATEWNVENDTTVDATFTSAAWGAIGVEVKAATTDWWLPKEPHLYLAMAVTGTTSTFNRAVAGSYERAAGFLELTSACPLPSTCTPVAMTTTGRFPIAGLSRRTLI